MAWTTPRWTACCVRWATPPAAACSTTCATPPGITLSALADGFALSRQAVSKHLAVLEAADLVVTLWRGREKLHYLNPVPLQALPTRWVTTSAQAHTAALLALQQALAGDTP